MEGHKSVQTAAGRNHKVNRLAGATGQHVNTAAVNQLAVLRRPSGTDQVIRRFRFRLRLLEGHCIVVNLNLVKLEVRYMLDGIPYAEASDQQCRAAADAQNHHNQTALIAQHVAYRNFVQEAQPPPQGCDILQEYPPSSPRGLGTQQLSRLPFQLHAAGQVRCPHGAQQSRGKGYCQQSR